MRQEDPANFWKSANLEEFLNEKRMSLGLDPVYLSHKLIPLAKATTDLQQFSLFEEDDNECTGYCFV